jgi:hypothetical protein
MIIQINATVCAALDHGAGGQLKIAGRDKRKMVQESQGRGQLPGGTTNPQSTAGVPVLPADANGVARRSPSLRE